MTSITQRTETKASIGIEPTGVNDGCLIAINWRTDPFGNYQYDPARNARLLRGLEVRVLTEADAADPTNQIRRIMVGVGRGLCFDTNFAICDGNDEKETLELMIRALICFTLENAAEIRDYLGAHT
jgi:hypothetical protein